MGRPQSAPGVLGSVSVVKTAAGFTARGRVRDAGGRMHRPRATAETEGDALAALEKKARGLAHLPDELTMDTSVGTFLDMWIEDRRDHVRPQTLRIYEDIVRWLRPEVAAIGVGELTAPRVRKVLRSIRTNRSAGAERHARSALSGALGIAVEEGAIVQNPVKELRRLQREHKMPTMLTVEQVKEFRSAVRRDERLNEHAGWSRAHLRWVSEVMLGSGLRLGEVCALRNTDVVPQLDGSVWVSVTGTIVDDEDLNPVRQEELKGRGQARRIRIARFAGRALAEAQSFQTTPEMRAPLAPAIPGRPWKGNSGFVRPRNIRRSLRRVRKTDRALQMSLKAGGLEHEDLTPHLLRRTAATLILIDSGQISDAQALLGHATEAMTRSAYIGSAWRATADASRLEQILELADE